MTPLMTSDCFGRPLMTSDCVPHQVSLELEKGKSLLVKLVSIPPPNEDGIRQVIMELINYPPPRNDYH